MNDTVSHSEPITYQLFGRQSFVEPLSYVERLELPAGVPLDETARRRAGAAHWVELIAIPESSIVSVIDEGPPR
jgi:hypothetical protein